MMSKSTSGVSVTSGSHPQFTLSTPSASYIFHVDPETLELVHDHYGSRLSDPIPYDRVDINGQTGQLAITSREFPDSGRGDFRLPAIHLRNGDGCTVSEFTYVSHKIITGKSRESQTTGGLPATYGDEASVTSLEIHLKDEVNDVEVVLNYGVFHNLDAITRSFSLKNDGNGEVVVERAESFSVDLESGEYDFVGLRGEWPREGRKIRRKVDYGTQGFQSSAGYSSHFHNPFVALVAPETDEHQGTAFGFNLIYTGSHSTSIERGTQGTVRVLMGLNPMHLSYPLSSGETFFAPECVSVYSTSGLGGMSRIYHRLYRDHLITSKEWVYKDRPCLINNWEATYFDFTTEKLYDIASTASELGVKMFVMDDGWFGSKHPRVNDDAGLGDWVVNPDRFPNGLGPFVEKVNKLGRDKSMKFGLWVEPEMVNPKSELYETHPDWVLHAPKRTRTEQRRQLVLNLSLTEVQDYLIESLSDLLSSANIEYIKWDNNRSMHELAHPSVAHKYMFGLYRVLSTLTSKFPKVLWEGCASGGGRFDAGILAYFPQTWTSDNTDGLERIFTQFGTSLAYPPSSMGCHVAAVPNHQMHRTTPLEFRAHVAMMGGSFGFELDLGAISSDEKAAIPAIVALSEKVNPYVIHGDLYRLELPEESNWPAAFYIDPRSGNGVLLAYQIRSTIKQVLPPLKLRGLEESARYEVAGKEWSGASLMKSGLKFIWEGDYQSRCIFVTKL